MAVQLQENPRRQRALDRLQMALQPILAGAAIEELELIASRAEGVLSSETDSTAKNDLIAALTEGRSYSAPERIALEFENQARFFQQRKSLLAGSLTSSQVATLLGTSRQTPHDRVKGNTLLAISEHGRLMFPPWQFDPAGPHGVVDGLPQVLRALNTSSFAKAMWLTLPNAILDGNSPIDVLKAGSLEHVVDAARAVGVS